MMVAVVWMFLVTKRYVSNLKTKSNLLYLIFSYSIASCFWATVGLGESLHIWQEWPHSCVCMYVWKFCLRRQQEIKRAHSSWPSFNLLEESCLAKIFIPQKVFFFSYCWARFRHCSVHFKVITSFQSGNSASHNCNFHSIQVLKKTLFLDRKNSSALLFFFLLFLLLFVYFDVKNKQLHVHAAVTVPELISSLHKWHLYAHTHRHTHNIYFILYK